MARFKCDRCGFDVGGGKDIPRSGGSEDLGFIGFGIWSG